MAYSTLGLGGMRSEKALVWLILVPPTRKRVLGMPQGPDMSQENILTHRPIPLKVCFLDPPKPSLQKDPKSILASHLMQILPPRKPLISVLFAQVSRSSQEVFCAWL